MAEVTAEPTVEPEPDLADSPAAGEPSAAPGEESPVSVEQFQPPTLVVEPLAMVLACEIARPRPVGAFGITLVYDPRVVRITGVDDLAFAGIPDRRKTLIWNEGEHAGVVKILGFHVDRAESGPSGPALSLVRLDLSAVGEGECRIEGSLDTLADFDGRPIEAHLSISSLLVRVRRR